MCIRDRLKPFHYIVDGGAGGEEQYRGLFVGLPDAAHHFKAVHAGHHHVCHQHVGTEVEELAQSLFTVCSAINDVVEGFELGANDYLKKPFGMQELIIRIKALVGKAFSFTEENPKETTVFEIGDYRFNSVTQRLAFAGSTPTSPDADTEVELSHRESEILKRLCENRNQVVNTQNVLLDLWGDDSFFNSRSLHVFITKLRHKLAGDERIRIVNVRGIGYKLIVN